jgi:hypothetical protein
MCDNSTKRRLDQVRSTKTNSTKRQVDQISVQPNDNLTKYQLYQMTSRPNANSTKRRLRCHDRKSRAEHESKKIISLQLHFKYQRTKDQGPRPRLKWREGAVYSITSNTRGPRTKAQTEVERRSSLQHHFTYQRTKDQGPD